MKKETIINALIGIGVLIIIILLTSVIIEKMGERINYDCEKQNFTGTVHYWDADVDCEKYSYGISQQEDTK